MNLKNISISTVRWFVGGFFALGALVELSEKALVTGLASAVLTVMLIPPAAKFLYAKIKRPIPLVAKVGIGIALFFLMVLHNTTIKPDENCLFHSPTGHGFSYFSISSSWHRNDFITNTHR